MNSRKISVEILNQVLNKGGYSNIVLGRALNESSLSEKDRGLVTEIVYGTIKYKYTIDNILKTFLKNPLNKMDVSILNLLRASIYQMKYLDKVPDYAVVNEAVNISKKISIGASKLVNGVLRNYLRNKDEIALKYGDEIEKLSIDYSFEPWMVKLFVNQLGVDGAEAVLAGLNCTPDVTVRVNTLKSSYDEVFDTLVEMEYNVEPGYVSPDAIKIIRGKSIENNSLFKSGHITVQDESAMLVAEVMELKENMIVMDLCSAPGGKATHMSELMNNTGRVLAFDVHENKLGLINENAARLGITNLECDVMDAAVYNERYKDFAHRVLIDVPCSGLGIIRKKPEIKWNKSFKDIKEIVNIQEKIIRNAAQYVLPEGILLYSTCTINKMENEDIVSRFLKSNSNFKLEQINVGQRDNLKYHGNGMLTVLPNNKMDGFFIAKLRRLW
jgi:16S rRNA (cytosine967-C5)-methyltransferase